MPVNTIEFRRRGSMISRFLMGVCGLLIVYALCIGGMTASSMMHEMLTPGLSVLYPVWLWIGLLPLTWVAFRTLDYTLTLRGYLAVLLIAVVGGAIMRWVFAAVHQPARAIVNFSAYLIVSAYAIRWLYRLVRNAVTR